MAKRIEALTDEQRARMPEWADKWIKIGLSTERLDLARFKHGLDAAYTFIGKTTPKRYITVSSPLILALAAPIAAYLWSRSNNRDRVTPGALGNEVGNALDIAVGSAVRGALGDAVRGAVGDAVGVAVGDAVGVAVGVAVVNAVVNAVDIPVGDVLGNALGDAVRGAVGGAVDIAVGDAVGVAVVNAVDIPVGDVLGNAVRGAVGGAVNSAVSDAVRGAVRDALGNAVNSAVLGNWHKYLGGQFWVGGWYWASPSYVSFLTDVCELELNADIAARARAYQDICSSACWSWPHTEFCMVSDRPTKVLRDNQGRLHSLEGQAIEWSDGWGIYSIHGVTFNKELYERVVARNMTFTDVMKLDNIEQRMIALRLLDPDQLLTGANAELISTGTFGAQIYRIDNEDLFDEVAYFARYSCPSTGRVYISGIDPNVAKQYDGDADWCMAWKQSLTKDEYLSQFVQS